MRIVMVSHVFPRDDGDPAGASIWRLAEALVRRDHEVTVVAPSDRGDVGATKLGEVTVRRVRYATAALETLAYRRPPSLLRNPLAAFAYSGMIRTLAKDTGEVIKQVRAQVIHAHFALPAGIAVRMAERSGRPYIVTVHDGEEAQIRSVPGGRRLTTWALAGAGMVTAVNSSLASATAEVLDVPRDRIAVTPMPIALGLTAHPDSARAGAIFVGRLEREMSIERLLDGLAELKRRGRPLDITIVGDGPERAALKARAISLGLATDFTGFLDNAEISARMRDKRVLVLPAVGDDSGPIIAEALTHGVPVVAPRGAGVGDLFADADAGVLLPSSDAGAMADALGAVIADDRFVVGAARAGRILVDRRSPEKLAQQWESLYTRTRAAGPRPSVAST